MSDKKEKPVGLKLRSDFVPPKYRRRFRHGSPRYRLCGKCQGRLFTVIGRDLVCHNCGDTQANELKPW